jgi:hypothetical protein
VLFRPPDRTDENDRRVAVALWREERSVPEAAHVLGLTEAQVRNSHKRNIADLAKVLRNYQASQKGVRRNVIGTQTHVQVLKEALYAVGNQNQLELVRQNAASISRDLKDAEEDLLEGQLSDLNPQWVAKVFAALSQEEHVSEADDSLNENLWQGKQAEDGEIGRAFEQILLVNLPPVFLQSEQFEQLERVSDEYRRHLLRLPDVLASPYARDFLTVYGITPTTILWATEAVGGLLERLIRKGEFTPDAPITLAELPPSAHYQLLEFSRVTHEVSRITELPASSSAVLTRWCMNLAHYKPLLFPFVFARPLAHHAIELRWTGDKQPDLLKRWATAPLRTE